MDSRMPGTDGYANNTTNNLFGDSQQFNAYDNVSLFPPTSDSNFNDAGWGLHATTDYSTQSREHHPVPSWQQNANHLSGTSAQASFSAQPSPYGHSLNQNTAPYAAAAFSNFGGQQNFPYRQPQYDPSLAAQSSNGQNYNLGIHGFNSSAPNGGTITPQALNRDAQPGFSANPYGVNGFPSNFAPQLPNRSNSAAHSNGVVDQKALAASVPKGANSGMFSIINFDTLARTTKSERMDNFINVGKEALEWDCTRSAIPAYLHRKSRNDLRAAANGNQAILAKIGKVALNARTSASNNAKAFSSSVSSPQIKYDEESSSTDESSDDDSAYSEDDDADSPLPAKRPDTPKGGVEYDTIQALWRSKRRTLSGDTIRQGLVSFWELVRTIRDRWKVDAAAVTEAEDKKRTGELPLLQSRVKDQRDMIETAFKAALKHGHRDILEILSENVALMFLCYQFLLDRFKADDVNGSLARAILETMSAFTTLTKDKIERTHLDKVFPRLQKKGDAKTQYYVKKINTNSEIADKEAAQKVDLKKTIKTESTSVDTKVASPAKKPAPEPVAGIKRTAATTSGDGSALKKVATGASKLAGPTTSSKMNGVVKRPASGVDPAAKSATASAPGTTRKTVVAKPSGFFSNLQSASKKPGTSIADKTTTANPKPAASRPVNTPAPKPAFSFAETMANLSKPKEEKPAPKVEKVIPNETEEARAKRLRKEARSKLHVRFKDTDELVQIRYFTHHPEEETDHDSSQMRDVSDVGGEGRMFKQQSQLMDIDDEDDIEEPEILRDHSPPSLVDFSDVNEDERKRNYTPYGGGELEIESTERAAREAYESDHLIVFYPNRSQIPPNPREPADPYNGQLGDPVKDFALPEEKYAARARVNKSRRYPVPHAFGQNFAQPPFAQQTAPSNPDIQSILASLRQSAPALAQQSLPQPPPPTYSQLYAGGQGSTAYQPAPTAQVPPANIDLAAILASLNAGGAQPNSYMATGATQTTSFPSQPQMGNMSGASDTEGMRHPNYKTRACKFWMEGRCQKGEDCSYLHQ